MKGTHIEGTAPFLLADFIVSIPMSFGMSMSIFIIDLSGVVRYIPVMAKKRKALHQPPQEFAKAKEMREYWPWRERQERAIRRAELDRKRVMPAHPKPSVTNFLNWDESYEHGRQRLANRKANKKFI